MLAIHDGLHDRWRQACQTQEPADVGRIDFLPCGQVFDGGVGAIKQQPLPAHPARDLQTALAATLRYCPVLATEPEGRLAAIVDFTFNLGAGRLQTSTLRRRVNQRDWPGAAAQLSQWIYGGGRVLPGLKYRRSEEKKILLKPV